MLAGGIAVDVVRARTSHQFVSNVVDGDDVLVVFGVVVALISNFDEFGNFVFRHFIQSNMIGTITELLLNGLDCLIEL